MPEGSSTGSIARKLLRNSKQQKEGLLVRERSRATVSQLIRKRVKKETKLERGTGSALVFKAKSHMKDKTQHETRNTKLG